MVTDSEPSVVLVPPMNTDLHGCDVNLPWLWSAFGIDNPAKRGDKAFWNRYHIRLSQRSYYLHVQLISCVRLFAIPWTAACQASLSFAISWNLLKLMSIKLVMPAIHLILCHPLLLLPSVFASIRVFSSELALQIKCQNIGASVSASVLPMNI